MVYAKRRQKVHTPLSWRPWRGQKHHPTRHWPAMERLTNTSCGYGHYGLVGILSNYFYQLAQLNMNKGSAMVTVLRVTRHCTRTRHTTRIGLNIWFWIITNFNLNCMHKVYIIQLNIIFYYIGKIESRYMVIIAERNFDDLKLYDPE